LAPAQSPSNTGATSEITLCGADAAGALLPDERPSENAEGNAIRRNAADNRVIRRSMDVLITVFSALSPPTPSDLTTVDTN